MNPREYFRTLTALLSQTRPYVEELAKPFFQTLVFFLISFGLMGLISALHFVVVDVPQLKAQTSQVLTEVDQRFPAELAINWDEQTLSHNQAEPLVIPYPSIFDPNQLEFPPVLAYHFNQAYAPESFNALLPTPSLSVITTDTLFVTDFQGAWNQIPLHEVPYFAQPFTINRQSLPTLIKTVSTSLESFFASLNILAFLFFPLLWISQHAWAIVPNSFLVYFLFRLNGLPLKFSQILHLSMPIMVVAGLINFIANYLYPTMTVPLLSISFWLILISVVISQRSYLKRLTQGETQQQPKRG